LRRPGTSGLRKERHTGRGRKKKSVAAGLGLERGTLKIGKKKGGGKRIGGDKNKLYERTGLEDKNYETTFVEKKRKVQNALPSERRCLFKETANNY